ncbi:glycosyltransferase [Candidatus Dojkabacteria bacterium]|nr:glycosyltransferase [Candidatus Dojkabacteria bacterium]
MISIIITGWKEPKTIGNAIKSLLDPKINELPEEFEVIQLSPDNETINAGKAAFKKLGLTRNTKNPQYYKIIKDPGKGKPVALNIAFKEAKGEILVLTDGDVYLSPNSVKNFLEVFTDEKIGGVSGRPVSADSDESPMGFYGNLLADAAHHKRMIDLTENAQGFGTKIVKKRKFFPMSGYAMAIRNIKLELPQDVLSDDAFISYSLFNRGYRIAYQPEVKAYVKYASSLSDYFKQKKRSLGGFIQLWKYNIVKPETKSRSFWHEIEYFWFPVKYSRNLKQFTWAIFLYPIRLFLWIQIWFERKFKEKSFEKTWVRIESTK